MFFKVETNLKKLTVIILKGTTIEIARVNLQSKKCTFIYLLWKLVFWDWHKGEKSESPKEPCRLACIFKPANCICLNKYPCILSQNNNNNNNSQSSSSSHSSSNPHGCPMLQMDISLKGQVVILDEAHNIEDSSREAASGSLTTDQINNAVRNLNELSMYCNIARKGHKGGLLFLFKDFCCNFLKKRV